MNKLPLSAALLAATLSLAVAPALAVAETPTPTTVPVPTPPVPIAGTVKLALQKVGGAPPFALVGGRIVVQGLVTPYVAEQTVKVSFYRDGHKFGVKTVSVLPTGKGTGVFKLNFASKDAGMV